MALESTQPLTEMSTRNLPGRPVRKADNLTAMCELYLTFYLRWEHKVKEPASAEDSQYAAPKLLFSAIKGEVVHITL
jgi:hypothetical protein